ncbi:hypothetical protein [Streptomyces sp. NRRL F-5123]|uniref:hypothetical protein n=1 Tax=Streptomyces sp. NRRL F-5123 TaxID=1463856 RepID=UPI00069395F4|nr:hypothetical protein [Streptomyces sp. NRRL F-5123]
MKLFRRLFRPTVVEVTVNHRAPERLIDAVDDLAAVFTRLGTAEAGGHFTCSEADAIARVLAVSGNEGVAIDWLCGHATDDEVDDMHHVYDEDDPEGEGRVMTDDEIAEYVAELAL